ncbi:hypothetical protein [Streptomyces fradiae]|uniref:hypothetical protein n=1 Tax=Streptomyces fradiae TaxID=1906 RepID=UPI0035BE3C08
MPPGARPAAPPATRRRPAADRRKGDGDTATWLPPSREYRGRDAARQVAVRKKYGVWVTAAERDAIRRVLSGCPSEPPP